MIEGYSKIKIKRKIQASLKYMNMENLNSNIGWQLSY